jgi:Uma2 family endonuclease
MGTRTETPRLTFEEFERLPDEPGKRELLEGELVELPPAKINHSRIARRIFNRLQPAVAGAPPGRLSEVCIETGYRLGRRTWVQPDVSVTHPGQHEGDYLEGAPALAIEVISPGNRAADVEVKTDLYFEHGALEVWRVYPRNRRVVIYSGGASNVRVEHEQVTTPLLPGFSLSIAEILGA